MQIFFSVGEPSGDLHAANLIRMLKRRTPQCQAVGYGGPLMAEAGCQLQYDLTRLAVMFLSGAIWNLRTFLKLVARADDYFAKHPVDAVVLIDYPGFNWWIARKAKAHGIPVFYYGVPQMWAWGSWRIGKVRKFVDYVICKLPFEKKWFEARGCEAFYVGHPYFDQLNSQICDQDFIQSQRDQSRQTVLLLPGSRGMELKRNLKTLFSVAANVRAKHPDARVVMGCLNAAHQATANNAKEKAGVDCEIFSGRTQELMELSSVCVACSGSVSLELLHHRLPTVIVYKLGLGIFLLQIFALRCKFISLPNLMMTDDIRKQRWLPYNPDSPDAEPVLMPEYLTWRESSARVSARLLNWMDSESERQRVADGLGRLADQYAIPGATARAAEFILSKLAHESNVSNSAA